MSEWIVYSKDGLTERCRLKKLEYAGSYMNERTVTATFEYHSEVAFEVFDYIVYRGERFELEAIPSVKKTSKFGYTYELRFVSLKYELERCEMRDIVPNDNGVTYPSPLSFSFTGSVRYLAERIQANLDSLYGKGVWTISVASEVSNEEKNITISQQNCWNALSLVNTSYGLDFSIKGRNVTIGKKQPVVSHVFQYGKGNGLYEIERVADTGTGIVTKLRAYGSTRNLDYSYPKKPEWTDSVLPVSFILSPLRLMLPSFKLDGKTDYVMANDSVVEEYGIRESSMIYEDIYPTITDVVNSNGDSIDEIMAVEEVDDSSSTFVVYLYDLGFDLESHLTTEDAQISMKSGAMQGYTFNISKIEKQADNTYKITLGRITTDSSNTGNYDIPNSQWGMSAGDKFVLLNILMPQEYIRAAEQRLLVRAQEYLAEYGKTNFSYNIGLNDKFLKEHENIYDELIEGSKLSVYDEELGIREEVTIQSITIDDYMEDNILPQVKVTLNNKPSASTLERIQGKINELSDSASNSFSTQTELLQQYRKKLDKPFFDRLFAAVDKDGKEIPSTDLSTPISYIKARFSLASLGGITMYLNDKSFDLPSIYDGLPIDSQTIYWEDIKDGNGVVIGKILKAKTGGGTLGSLTNVGEWADSVADVDRIMVQKKGSDTWEAMDVSGIGSASFENISESGEGNAYTSFELSEDKKSLTLVKGETFALASDLENKWTTDEELINNWNTAFGWGNHAEAGYAAKSYVDSTFVTIAGNEDVTGVHNFVNGLKIGGKLIDKPQDDVIYIDANLVVRGGITMYGDRDANIPSILNSIPTAGYDDIQARGLIAFNSKHFVINNGVVSAIQGSAGLDVEQLDNYLKNNHYATEDWVKEYIVEINTGETVNITKQMVLDALEYIPYDASNPNGYITSATLDGYLPLTGGVINGWVNIRNNKSTEGTLQITGVSTKPIIRFEGDVSWGYLGFGSANNPCYYDNSLREYSLIHSGNIGSQSVNYATTAGNADTLDGVIENEFLRYRGSLAGIHQNNVPYNGSYTVPDGDVSSLGYPRNNAHLINIVGDGFTQLLVDYTGVSFIRQRWYSNEPSPWKQLAFTDSNVASATKLQTTRTIWGQSFDGMSDITGNIILPNSSKIFIKDASNNDVCVSQIYGNDVHFGDGANSKGYDTYIGGNRIIMRYGTSSTCGFMLSEIGNVGIGEMIYPQHKLDVNGDIYSRNKVIINGISLSKSQDGVLYLDGNLVVKGGVTMYGTDATSAPSILDSLPIASTSAKGIAQFSGDYFTVSDGIVRIIDGSVGLKESELNAILDGKNYATKTDLNGYLPLSGGVLTDILTIKSGGGYGLKIQSTNNDIPSIVFSGTSGSLGRIFINGLNGSFYRANNNFSAMSKIWDEGNDGSGSGLDADMLDGREGSGYTYHINGFTTEDRKYIKIATLPASSVGTYDSVTISGTIGGWYSYEKADLKITVGRRDSVIFKGYSYPRNGWDILVNNNGEVLIHFNEQYRAWDLSVTCIQAMFDYKADYTPTDTNFTKMSDSRYIVWFNNNGSVASATKLSDNTSFTIWGQEFFVNGKPKSVNGAFRLLREIPGTVVIHKALVYPTSPYGLITRAYIDGDISLQVQREDNDSEYFNLLLNPLGGNVGIGTNSPSTKLHIIQSNFDDGITIDRSASGAGASIRVNSNGTYIGNFGINGNKIFEINLHDGSNLKNVFLVNLSGNVGIGTTRPAYKLDVNGTIYGDLKMKTPRTIWGQSFDGSGDVNGVLTFNNLGGANPTIKWSYGEYFDNRGNFHLAASSGDFNIYNSSNNVLFRVVHSSGNVGIGTTSPAYPLDVNGRIRATILEATESIHANCVALDLNDVWSDGTNSHVWYGYDHRYPNSGVYSTTISDYFGMTLKTANIGVFLTQTNMGVGISKPSKYLHIGGTFGNDYVYANFNTANPYLALKENSNTWYVQGLSNYLCIGSISSKSLKIDANGNVLVVGGLTMYSQLSLKDVVDERGLSLSELSTIKPTRYTWKDGRDNKIHIGGIADDIQQVLPEVVYKTAEGVLTMDYGNAGFAIAASLIKPVVDHEEKIRQLQNRVSELEQELNRLRA